MRISNIFHNLSAKLVLLGAAFVFLGAAVPVAAAQTNGSAKPPTFLLPEAEKLPADLGYRIMQVDGKEDASTSHAITAFQKVEGRRRTGV